MSTIYGEGYVADMLKPSFKPKTCPVCQRGFIPLRAMQQVCGPVCAHKKVKADKAKGKRELRERKQALMKVSEARALAQKEFNLYVRLRDVSLPCVSCGVVNPPMLPGGQWDAGHFLSRGAYPELAFTEDNCWKQCKSCNAGAGKFSHKERTVSEKYEAELLNRIGPERLAALKAPHPPLKLSVAGYLELRDKYREKRKELEKERGEA